LAARRFCSQHADAAEHSERRRRDHHGAKHGNDIQRTLRVALEATTDVVALKRLAVGVHNARLRREAAQVFACAGTTENFRASAELGVNAIRGSEGDACEKRTSERKKKKKN
jgi:hypothetical protein